MRGGALPPALLCAALGLLLAYAPRRWIAPAIAALVVAAMAVALLSIPEWATEIVFAGCWISVVLTALSLHLPGEKGPRLILPLATNAGVWAGAVTAVAGRPTDLAIALPMALLCLPAAWVLTTPARLGVKILASWLVAVAVLAAAVPLTPTAGYEPDHMD